VRAGDGLSTIAARFGLTVDAILDANPDIPSANTIYSGQVIRLQYQPAAT
jgi:LysM repeat protein